MMPPAPADVFLVVDLQQHWMISSILRQLHLEVIKQDEEEEVFAVVVVVVVLVVVVVKEEEVVVDDMSDCHDGDIQIRIQHRSAPLRPYYPHNNKLLSSQSFPSIQRI